ncbi:hypothetical protein V6N12_068999 [Hibiscus sabdariffa]|uniref:Uncharacterized protein n=1 Tax=Hibiscus sabdariffa TaxID=183260 RepID=A0ABR2CAF8_9ROSI
MLQNEKGRGLRKRQRFTKALQRVKELMAQPKDAIVLNQLATQSPPMLEPKYQRDMIVAHETTNQPPSKKLLRVLGSKADTILNEEDASPIKTNLQVPPLRPPIDHGKAPINVTIIDDSERYSYDPNAPGLLASKPTIPPSTTTTTNTPQIRATNPNS